MAAKAVKEAAPDQVLRKTAEDWAIAKQVPGVYLEGVKQRQGWAKNKMLEENEFDVALREFLKAAADGRTR
ncbi:hypothetical protein [Parablautia sp. Marseille-Q6255]|uniref:hypothetical protein n=1 Tax=Parablautia sp. Marseille-Q6255 TaxID=3039593 RepID=UPI0024BCC3F1|nr:hypothetical protein [Parablautia sp. Marseille-Q6255]